MLLELIIKHLFISFGLFIFLVYYSYKGLATFRNRYKRWPVFWEYTILLFASFFTLLNFDPRPNSHGYGASSTPSLSSILIGLGILIGTSIRFALLVRDYNMKTALYITAVNFSIVAFIFFILLAYGAGQPERDKKKKEEEEKKKKEEEEAKKKNGYYYRR